MLRHTLVLLLTTTAIAQVPVDAPVLLTGRVLDQRGEGVPQAQLRIVHWSAPETVLATGSSDRDGWYRIPAPPRSSWTVLASSPGRCTGEGAASAANEFLTITVHDAATVRGVLRNRAGEPTAGAVVRGNAGGRDLRAADVFATTAADGSFVLAGMALGPVKVSAVVPGEGLYTGRQLVTGDCEVVLQQHPGDRSDIEIQVNGVPPARLADVVISLWSTRGFLLLPPPWQRLRFAADGTCRLRDLPDTSFTIRLGSDAYAFEPTAVVLEPGPSPRRATFTARDLAAQSTPCSLLLHDAAGAALPGVRVQMRGLADGRTTTAISDAEGRLVFDRRQARGDQVRIRSLDDRYVLDTAKDAEQPRFDPRRLRELDWVVAADAPPPLRAVPACTVTGLVRRPDGGPAAFAPVTLQAEAIVANTHTAADGTFRFGSLPHLDVPLTVSITCALGTAASEPFALATAGAAPELPPLVLAPAAVIEGLVLDERRQPVPGCRVQLLGARTASRPSLTERITDRAGRYRFVGVAPGDVQLMLRPFADERDPFDQQPLAPFAVAAGQTLTHDLVLPRDPLAPPKPPAPRAAAAQPDATAAVAPPLPSAPVNLRGRVIDMRGRAVPAAAVSVTPWHAPESEAVHTRSDGDGAFLLPRLPWTGSLRLHASAPGSCIVEERIEDPALPITLRLLAGVTLRGVLRDRSGRPVADTPVRGIGYQPRRSGDFVTTTDADGAFVLEHTPIGAVSIVTAVAGEGMYWRNFRVTGDATIELQPSGGAVTGITIEATELPISLASPVQVDLLPNHTDNGLPPPWLLPRLGADGRGELRELPAVPYTIRLRHPELHFTPATVRLLPADPERTVRFRAVARDAAPRLRAMLHDFDGAPLATVRLQLFGDRSTQRCEASTDANGDLAFAIDALPGTTIRIASMDERWVMTQTKGPYPEPHAWALYSLPLPAAGAERIDLRAEAACTAQLTVRGPGGQPAAGVRAELEAFVANRWLPVTAAGSDAAGSVRLTGLRASRWPLRVRVMDMSGYGITETFELQSLGTSAALPPLQLAAPATLAAVVRNTAGAPVPGIEAVLVADGIEHCVITDAAGRCAFWGLPGGDSFVWLRSPSGAPEPLQMGTFALLPGRTSEVELVMK